MDVCGNCGQEAGNPFRAAYSTYIWSNQHGYEKRVFCMVCGCWTDIKYLYASDEIKEKCFEPKAWKYTPYPSKELISKVEALELERKWMELPPEDLFPF